MFNGLVRYLFVPPFIEGGVEQDRLVDNVVSKTDKLGVQRCIASFCCNLVPSMKLLKYLLDGAGRFP